MEGSTPMKIASFLLIIDILSIADDENKDCQDIVFDLVDNAEQPL